MAIPQWRDLGLLILVTLMVQSVHLGADWDETLWGMEGTFYGIGVKNFFRFAPEDHRFLLLQNGSPEVDEPLKFYARTLMPYYWAEGLSVWIFGDRPWAYRLVSVVHGWLLPIFLYLLVREFSDRRTALIAGVLAGASPMVGYYSTCTYSGPTACYLPAALWAYSRWRKAKTRGALVAFALLVLLCWTGNYFNLFFLPVLIALHGLTGGRLFPFAIWMVASFAAVHGLQLLHILTVDPTLKIFFGNVFEWTAGRSDKVSSGYSLPVVANVFYTLARLLTPMTLGLAILGGGSLIASKSMDRTGIPFLLTLGIPGILILLIFPGHTLIHEHDFYWLVAPMAWLAAIGLRSLEGANLVKAVPALLLFILSALCFYRGNLACWYEPGRTDLMLLVLSVPMILLVGFLFLTKRSPSKVAIVLATWTIGSVFYTTTLWGDSARVDEAKWIRQISEPDHRIAKIGRVYPLDLFYAERSMSPDAGPATTDGKGIERWRDSLVEKGFEWAILPANFPDRAMAERIESILPTETKGRSLSIRLNPSESDSPLTGSPLN